MKKVLIAAALATCVSGTALADANDSIKYRQNAMKTVGAQMGSIVAILKGEVDNKPALARHVALIGEATSTEITIPAFTPNTDGQGDRETTATAAIWSDWDKFEKGLKELEAAGQAAAEAGADIGADEVKALGAACKACHDNFRQK